MNMYRALGDGIGTSEAREPAEQLVAWHDAMVSTCGAKEPTFLRAHGEGRRVSTTAVARDRAAELLTAL